MSQLRLIRASAGSGKTYTITSSYLRLLFKNAYSYRNTLAVTFTNKATAEMKGRILSELYQLASNRKSNHAESLKAEFQLSDEALQKKAREILDSILHNYSRFSVTTIDSFFQGIIRSFAREAGIQYNYDLALDVNIVLEKAVDLLMLKLENDKTLLDWMTDFSENRIEEGQSWDFRKGLIKLGKEIFNEQFLSFSPAFHEKISNREFLKNLYSELLKIKTSFEKPFKEGGIEAIKIIKAHGLHPYDFKYKNQGGVGGYFIKLSQGQIPEPLKRILDACESIENWLPKEPDLAIKARDAANNGLFDLLNKLVNLYQQDFYMYESARLALQNFYMLGILADLTHAIHENANSENVFVLANAGPFLKAIIGENDTPFIYEKTGQVYKNFMIDEFQDTSGIQWENFKPLIVDSLASENFSMLVGDVKQSIYRWRNTDWKIMATQVEHDLDNFGVKDENLKYNWRSKTNIIAFNNSLFYSAINDVKNTFAGELSESKLEDDFKEFLIKMPLLAYQGAAQAFPEKAIENQGYVKIDFFEKSDLGFEEQSLEKLPEIIQHILSNGYKAKEIAILVRKVSEGRLVFDYLNEYKIDNADSALNFDVISDESAYLASSPAIQMLLKAFRYLVFPEDSLNLCALLNDYMAIFPAKDFFALPLSKQSSFINYAKDESFTTALSEKMVPLKALPPDSLLENFIQELHLNEKPEFLPFIQAFHDCVMQFCAQQSPSLAAFLDFWEENQQKYSVPVSEEQDAVRIITIHKSKGLEYKNVVIPFCDWDFDHRPTLAPVLWCPTEVAPFSQLEAIPVVYSSKMKESIFASHYFAEKVQFMVDNVNLLYVAFTRAEDNLFVCAPKPEKVEKISTADKLLYRQFSSHFTESQIISGINFEKFWNDETSVFEFGTLTQHSKAEQIDIEEVALMPLQQYPSYVVSESLRQKRLSPFFKKSNEIDRQIHYGNFMHRLFQEIRTVQDVGPAIKKLNQLGFVGKIDMKALETTMLEILSKEPYSQWFQPEWQVMNEAGIVIPNAHQYRPDRVIFNDKQAIVIDYKFGTRENNAYILQVQEYMESLKNMAFQKVEGYVWYVSLNKHVKVA